MNKCQISRNSLAFNFETMPRFRAKMDSAVAASSAKRNARFGAVRFGAAPVRKRGLTSASDGRGSSDLFLDRDLALQRAVVLKYFTHSKMRSQVSCHFPLSPRNRFYNFASKCPNSHESGYKNP